MTKKATLGQIAQLIAMCESGIYDRPFIQALIDRRTEALIDRLVGSLGSPYRGGSSSEKRDLITVPMGLSASELVARAKKKLNLTFLDEVGYASYDFVCDEGGKTFKVLIWKPGRYVETEEVRKHFADLGADGNATVFVVWVTERNPEGYYASIPSDDSRLCRDPESGILCAPDFYRDGDERGLRLGDVRDEWDDGWSFVAFREVQA